MYNLKEKICKNDKVVGYLVTDKSGADVKLSLNKALEIIEQDEIKGLSINSIYQDIGSLYRILDKKDNDVYLLNMSTQKKNKVDVSKVIEKLVSKKIYLENGFARRTKTGKWSLVCRELKNDVTPQSSQNTSTKIDNMNSQPSQNLEKQSSREIQEQQTNLYNSSFLDGKYISLSSHRIKLLSLYRHDSLEYFVNIVLYVEKTEGTRLVCRFCQDNNVYLRYGNPKIIIAKDHKGHNESSISTWISKKGLDYARKETKKFLKENQEIVGIYALTDSIIENIASLDIIGIIKEKFSEISIGNQGYPLDMLLSQPIYISESKIDGFFIINP